MPKIRTERVSEIVFDEILKIIQKNNFHPGDKFYSENQLCKELGVSRTSVREALRSMEALGRITVQHGRGIFIASAETHENEGFISWLKVNRNSILEHFEVRLMLEPKAAYYAGIKALDSDISGILKVCAEFAEKAPSNNIPELIQIDEQFHNEIAKSTKNRTLSILMKTMAKSLPVGWISSLNVPGRIEKTVHEHLSIAQAIQEHSPQKAEQHMTHHLENARHDIISFMESR